MFFIPVLVGKYHWVLTCIDPIYKEIMIFDSTDVSASIEKDVKAELKALQGAISLKHNEDTGKENQRDYKFVYYA